MTAHPELNTVWTSDRLGKLIKLHNEGKSATIIAREINGEYKTVFTRNAIIGACHRAGLQKRRSETLAWPHAIRPRRDNGGGSMHSIARRQITGTRQLPKQKASAAPFLGIELLDLEPNQCRFPRGENPILFCGQPQKEDSSYCPHCHSIAARSADAS